MFSCPLTEVMPSAFFTSGLVIGPYWSFGSGLNRFSGNWLGIGDCELTGEELGKE